MSFISENDKYDSGCTIEIDSEGSDNVYGCKIIV
jgi:hypothetical protein